MSGYSEQAVTLSSRNKCAHGRRMEYLSEIISFIVGALTGGITVKWHSVRSSKQSVRQEGIVAGGDVAGRDINK